MDGVMEIQPIRLEGSHVALEPLGLEHFEALCEIGLDPSLWEWTISDVRSPADMRAWIDDALRARDAGSALPFIIRDRASGRAAGSTRYGNIDGSNRRVEIGWTWIGSAWQRTRINTESKYLLLRHAFETVGCHRVELKTDVLNERSRRAILRIGATEEGILRRHAVTATGRIRDTVYYSVVAEEWPTVRTRLEALLERSIDSGGRVQP
jgi:RimJ/RimL family protein N-acetyltransferase